MKNLTALVARLEVATTVFLAQREALRLARAKEAAIEAMTLWPQARHAMRAGIHGVAFANDREGRVAFLPDGKIIEGRQCAPSMLSWVPEDEVLVYATTDETGPQLWSDYWTCVH
jgi:hypothetical protein